MFSGWLICVFTYNRPQLLQNLLTSARQYYPEMDLAVFDDGSTEPEQLQLLDRLRSEGTPVAVRGRGADKGQYGGLHYNMDSALRYAQEQGYRYAYFVQDDMQFLWRDEQLAARVVEAFLRPDCLMCNFNFMRKIQMHGLAERMPPADAPGYFRVAGWGVADTGVIDLRKAAGRGLHFPCHDEKENGAFWFRQGLQLYWLPQAHLAWLPWPTSFRHRRGQKHGLHVLNPLNGDGIARIRANRGYAYLEDYSSAPSLRLKPYWFTVNPGYPDLLKIYAKYYLKRLAGIDK